MSRGIGAVQAASVLLAGIFIGLKFHPPLLLCCLLLAAGTAGGIFFYRRGKDYVLDQMPKRLCRLFICLALFAAGMCRTAFRSPDHPDGAAERFVGQRFDGLTGYVIAPPVMTASRTTLRVKLDEVQPDPNFPNDGKLLLVFFRAPQTEFRYGDRITFSGTLLLPTDTGGGFSYREWLGRDGITCLINNPQVEMLPGFSGSHLRAGIYGLRARLLTQVYRLFPRPESALMAGILLGDESKITSDVDRAFQKTGTSHVIAISGSNFTLLLWVLISLIRRLVPRWWAPLLIMPFIPFYTILVGGNSAVVRAAIMCALSVFGSVLGRTGYGVNNLALTAAVMCLWKPAMLFDLGFQLSAVATLGILLFSEPLCNAVRGVIGKVFPKMSEDALNTAVSVLNEFCLMSVSAQVFTMWISAQAFGRISLISLPANFLIAPFQSMIMLGGFAALLLSFFFYPLGAAAAWLVWPAPALTIRIVRLCAEIPWGSVYSDLSAAQAWMMIGLIIALWLGRHKIAESIKRRNYQPYAVMLLLFAAIMIWTDAADRLNRRTEIIYHQTASSMTLSVRSPGNRLMVVGEGLTNYAAQDLLEKQLLPVRRVPEAASIDITESWMDKEFLASGAADGLSVLYLNGRATRPGTGTPEDLIPGSVLSVDGTELKLAASFLGKRAWVVENEGYSLLFSNGIPPERIFTRTGPDKREISLVIFGKRDDRERWTDYEIPLLDVSDRNDLTLEIKPGRVSYYP